VSALFYGRERSDLRRAARRSVSATMTRLNCLQLDLPPVGGGREGGRELKLEEVIEHSFREEVVENSDGSILRKKLCIDALPPVLVLHLKRFIFDMQRGAGVKLHQRVEYPSRLTLPPSLLSATLRATVAAEGGREGGGATFQLFAVGLHHGRSLNGGHYTVFCKEGGGREGGRAGGRAGGEWYGYDDERVENVQEGEVKRWMEQVYLLFYQRV
jgi:ubiquitin carboxyl-terminal hydrolase 10